MDIVLCILSLGLACPSDANNASNSNVQRQAQVQQVQEVPEPATIFGSLLAAGIGYSLKKVKKPD